MGQLEKYGLYVLCLVIFLILGVTIWGGGDVQAGKTPPASIRAPNGPTSAPPSTAGKDGHLRSLAETLLEPAPTGGPRPGGPAKDAGKDGGKSAGSASPPSNDSPKPDGKGDTKSDTKSDTKADAKTVAYKVQEGDTLVTIARAKLGKSGLWTEIQKLNPDVKPESLHPGQEIKLPTAAALAANNTAAAPSKAAADKPVVPAPDGSRTYVVVKGDNYERIAQTQLGTRSRATEVMDLNPGIEATKLKPGMSIKLPPK